MYCTLQEAYNVPSFDPSNTKKKRGCMTPLKKGVAEPGLPVDNQLNPYNSSPETGGEYAVAQVKYGREDFVSGPTQLRDNKGAYSDETTSYIGQGNNYKYYCDTYGICPKDKPSNVNLSYEDRVETFVGNVPKINEENTQKQCDRPLQAPPYTIPISDEAKQKYKDTMNVAMSSCGTEDTTVPVATKPRIADMSKVSGYYDEDLEQYLQTNQMKSAAIPMMPKVAPRKPEEPYDGDKTPFSKALAKYVPDQLGTPYPTIRQTTEVFTADKTPKSKLTDYDYIIDIVLFVLIGILIILLCDQIFRAAMLYGMKETMRVMNPYLQQRMQENMN